ncbi:MAG: biotin/lipoyl-containing protein, partial [Bacteriovoracaceae bacterium]
MALVDVIMPQMGESIAEGTISKWHKKVGDKIAKDETLLEISTDKVDSEIPAPAAGVIAELLFQETTTVGVNTIIARINTDVNASVSSSAPAPKPVAAPAQADPVPQQSQPAVSGGALVDVIMPQMGESIAEGTISKWHKKVGDKIGKDETLLEISTDKVDSEIPAPAAGIVAELLFPEQTTVGVNTVIAKISTGAGAVVSTHAPVQKPVSVVESKPVLTAQPVAASQQHTAREQISSDRFYSPLVLNIARTEGVSLSE